MTKEYPSYPVRIKIISQKGYYSMGLKRGDENRNCYELTLVEES